MPRATSFKLHISRMFNEVDVDHMSTRIDLTDHAVVKSWGPKIAARLKGVDGRTMPPAGDGGPWPEEWIALFDRWIAEGCPE